MAGRGTIIIRIDIWCRILYYDDVKVIFISRCSTETRKIRSELESAKFHGRTHGWSEANISKSHAGVVNLVAVMIEQVVGTEAAMTALPKEDIIFGAAVSNTFTSINSESDRD